MSRSKQEAEADELLEMRIVLRDGHPEASLTYNGVVIRQPMVHKYSLSESFDIWNAVARWIPDAVLKKHAAKGGD